MADISAIGKQFTDFYYTTFDSNRASLANLYVRSPRPYPARSPVAHPLSLPPDSATSPC